MFELWLHIIGIACILLFSLYSSIYFLMKPSSSAFTKLVATLIFAFTIVLMFRRDTYLPFLGYTVFPSALMPQEDVVPNGATEEAQIMFDKSVGDGTIVVYWASQPSNTVADKPSDAYDRYRNSGITTVKNGKAKIKFACPGEYYVPLKYKLKRHVHYRLCCAKYGLMSPVKTMYVRC